MADTAASDRQKIAAKNAEISEEFAFNHFRNPKKT
jgi:hypothetical protein